MIIFRATLTALLVASAIPSPAAPARADRAVAQSELDVLLRQLTSRSQAASTRLRARVSTRGGGSTAPAQVMQILIKTRSEPEGARSWTYEVLWPKSHAGWAQSIHVAKDGTARVTRQEPGQQAREMGSPEGVNLLPGVSLTLDDTTPAFLTWPIHEQVGTEVVDGRDCLVAAFRKEHEGGSLVRAWIARREAIVLKVEHVSPSSKVVRRISMSRIVKADDGWVAGTVRVEDLAAGSESEIAFSRGNEAARIPATGAGP